VSSSPFIRYNAGGCFPGNKATGDHSLPFIFFKYSIGMGMNSETLPAYSPGNGRNCISLCFGKTVFKLILGREAVRIGGEWNAV
jgi:hypothetical protein